MTPGTSPAAVVAVLLVSIATVVVGAFGLRLSRTTSDFYVASRAVSPSWNAAAISGEYLSAASFLGVAGLVLTGGADMLWFPVGYTAGYLVLLVLVAAPLRRSGAYTVPDFAELRLGSRGVRLTASVLVVGIGWLYLLPQLQGAGLALRAVTGLPGWTGALLVATVVVLNVVAGGMRSITFVQAFQYWLKLTAIALPGFVLLALWTADGRPSPASGGPPVARSATSTRLTTDTALRVDVGVRLHVAGTIDGRRVAGPVDLAPGDRPLLGGGTIVTVPAGAVVPHAGRTPAVSGDRWVLPLSGAGSRDHPLYSAYSVILALFFGTMGLPHVLVRFYTNPDGRAARRTTLAVIGLLGAFYLFPPLYGALGRVYAPDLLLSGRADSVVLLLPSRLVPGTGGQLLAALTAAGAFAAFLSTSSGLAMSVAGVLHQDLLLPARRRSPGARSGRSPLRTPRWGPSAERSRPASLQGFGRATLLAVGVPAALSLLSPTLSLADTVGLAFAVAASTFCPLLVLGVWWRGLTRVGAVAGLLTGGTLAIAAVVTTLVRGPAAGWPGALLSQPAAWSVPVAFAVTVLTSLATRDSAPADVGRTMVRLHAPEDVDVDRGPR